LLPIKSSLLITKAKLLGKYIGEIATDSTAQYAIGAKLPVNKTLDK
jgi:hypothetical protein